MSAALQLPVIWDTNNGPAAWNRGAAEPKTGTAHTLDYVMQKTDTGWKVIDVLADGSISRAALQRSDFSALFDKGGAPALQARLQEKTEALSRG